MSALSQQFEDGMKELAAGLHWIDQESEDLYKAFISTSAQSDVSGVSNATDPASLATKLTKAQYENGIGFVLQLIAFFAGDTFSQGDYLNVIENVKYGAATSSAGVPLSDAAEDCANRLKTLCDSALSHYQLAGRLKDLYDTSELSVVVGGMTGGRRVYGASMNVTQLTQGITLIEKYRLLLANGDIGTEAEYGVNVAVWTSL